MVYVGDGKYELPEDFAYTSQYVYVNPDNGDVGLSEIGFALLKPKSIKFLDMDAVTKEEPFAELETERTKIPLRAPVSGKVVMQTSKSLADIEKGPYDEPLIKVEGVAKDDLAKLVTGDAVKDWGEEEVDFLNRGEYAFKIVEIGESSVGKTAIKVRFTDDYFKRDLKSTLGIDFGSRVLDAEYMSDDIMMSGTKHLKIKCNVWDMGGQAVYQAQRKMYYGQAKGCLLIYDVTNPASFKALSKWMQELETNVGAKIPTLLVGNKIDLVDERKVDKAEAEQFAKEHGMSYLESSAKDGTGVTEAFKQLALDIYKLTIASK